MTDAKKDKPHWIVNTRFCWCSKCVSWECDCDEIKSFKKNESIKYHSKHVKTESLS